ncbi:pyrroline-5-carboxylate reductase [Bacillus fonticola]|uniref:pyrroline-5-carboxylate reductase n=1 Tax=Bacillus fonticola TaxID=2728853 RepID=UPI001474E366|nr:pyrroline-5-carboxylate reductase [Bacillus fonticola]
MKLACIGAGSMAEAMISGMVSTGVLAKEKIVVTNKQDKAKLERFSQVYGVCTSSSLPKTLDGADVVLLAMKPKDIGEACQALSSYIQDGTVLLSVVAGVETATIVSYFRSDIGVIRAMPNTSSHVGLSITSLFASENVSSEVYNEVHSWFQAIGEIIEAKTEEEMHSLTALFGSGPAYMYYVAESLQKAAENHGFDADAAQMFVTYMLRGTCEMLTQRQETPEALRVAITSPGGTTEAGVKTLQSHDVQDAFLHCIDAAAKRSRELATQFSRKQTDEQFVSANARKRLY